MFCLNCGTQLPGDANFCYKCGTPVGQTSPNKGIKLEYCQIRHDRISGLFGGEHWFWADAIGPKGKYKAAESPHYKPSKKIEYQLDHKQDRVKAETALHKLVEQLIVEGWEPISERGEWWWQLRFRRRVKQ